MEALLLLFGIILSGIVVLYLLKKLNIIPLIIISVSAYFWEYIIACGLLFWADLFSIRRGMFAVCVVNLIVCVLLILRKPHIEIDWNIRGYLVPILIVLAALPFNAEKYGFFGMGQDEGVYQTQAINFIYNKNDLQQDFEEYSSLDAEQQKSYKSAVENYLVGFYLYDSELPYVANDGAESDVSGYFHGIPTFSAILGLSGRILGIDHMSDIQTVFYFCLIFFAYMSLDLLNIKKWLKYILTLLLAFSPIVLWVSKSALTEMMLACMIAGFAYFILQRNSKTVIFSVLPIVSFCFFHLTIYTVIPAFVVTYWIMYVLERKKVYLWGGGIVSIAFFAGILMAMRTAATYSFVYNFVPVYRLIPGIDAGNVIFVYAGMTVLFLMITVLLPKFVPWIKNLREKRKLKFVASQSAWIIWGLRVMILCFTILQICLWFRYRESYQGLIGSFQHLSIVGYGMSLGMLLPIVAGLRLLIGTKSVIKEKNFSIVFFLFVYCILLYSVLFRQDILYYYYYGRYLVPYLFIIVLFMALILNGVSHYLVLAVGCLSLSGLIYIDTFFINYQDDTRLSWSVLGDLDTVIDAQDRVVIGTDYLMQLFWPIKTITGAQVYPADDDVFQQLVQLQEECEGNVYYISNDSWVYNDTEVVYQTQVIASEDAGTDCYSLFPFPKSSVSVQQKLCCYRYEKVQTYYDLSDKSRDLSCTGITQGDGVSAWINSSEFYLKCNLNKTDYTLLIQQGYTIPLDFLQKKSYAIEIFMNDQKVTTVILDASTNGQDINVEMPKEYINEGDNVLCIKSELWSPSEYGSPDDRMLGMGLRSISFY